MNKKVWFIIGGVALVGLAAFLYMKKRKADAAILSGESPLVQTPSTATPSTVTPGTGGGVGMPSGMSQMLRVVKDESKGKAIARVSPKNMFKVGDAVSVNGATYKGTYKIWYIYKTHPTEDAIYLDTPYISDDAGTVSLAK
jgi:LPXTG-motif cell wall-anchored protein